MIVEQQSKVVLTIVEVIVKIAGVNFIGEAIQRLISDVNEETGNAANTLAAYLGLVALVKSNNKEAIIEFIEEFAKKKVENIEDEEGSSTKIFYEEVRTIALEMKAT